MSKVELELEDAKRTLKEVQEKAQEIFNESTLNCLNMMKDEFEIIEERLEKLEKMASVTEIKINTVEPKIKLSISMFDKIINTYTKLFHAYCRKFKSISITLDADETLKEIKRIREEFKL